MQSSVSVSHLNVFFFPLRPLTSSLSNTEKHISWAGWPVSTIARFNLAVVIVAVAAASVCSYGPVLQLFVLFIFMQRLLGDMLSNLHARIRLGQGQLFRLGRRLPLGGLGGHLGIDV